MYTYPMDIKRALITFLTVFCAFVPPVHAEERGRAYVDPEHGIAFVVPPGFVTGRFEINTPGDWPFKEMIALIEPRLLKKASPDFIPPAFGLSCVTVRMRNGDARELFGYRDIPEQERVGESADYFLYRHADDRGTSATNAHYYLVAKEGKSYVLVDAHVRAEDGVNPARYVEALRSIAASMRRVTAS